MIVLLTLSSYSLLSLVFFSCPLGPGRDLLLLIMVYPQSLSSILVFHPNLRFNKFLIALYTFLQAKHVLH